MSPVLNLFATLCLVLGLCGGDQLPTLNVDKDSISVSGISSGAIMATQYHVAFSSEVIGAGFIAGVPYLCSPSLSCMKTPWIYHVSTFIGLTSSARLFLNIDATSNMKNDRVWIFAGTKDDVVNPYNANLIYDYYKYYLSSESQLKLVKDIPAAHGMITNNYGGKCGSLDEDFMNNCSYNAAYNLLNHIYGGSLKKPNPTFVADGQLLEFDQSPFTSLLATMAKTGYVYIPKACKNGANKCKLHVAFHGCSMGAYLIGDTYVRHAGYNEVGEQNNIIMLYPQMLSSPANLLGCWDWTGYTGIYYPFKKGFQMKAVHAMVGKVTG